MHYRWHTYVSRAKTPQAVVRAYAMFGTILADFANMRVLPFDANASRAFEELRQQRIRVATMDLRIAAIAISTEMKLLSRNLVDFEKIPGLDVEDWTAN